MIGKRSRQSEQNLEEMRRLLDRIESALVVRDPGTALSAHAYEGLRKQVVASATARLQHTAQIAEFDVALRRGATTEDLLIMVDQWLRQAGVERVEDPTTQDVWEVTLASGVDAVVDVPAYVDGVTMRLVRQGRLKENPLPADSSTDEAVLEPPEAVHPEEPPAREVAGEREAVVAEAVVAEAVVAEAEVAEAEVAEAEAAPEAAHGTDPVAPVGVSGAVDTSEES